MIAFGMMQDYLGPIKNMSPNISEMLSMIPKIDGHYIRDEALQAHEVVDQLGVLDSVGVDGSFVFTFVSPNSTYNEDSRFDGDLGSDNLVKSYPEAATNPERIRANPKNSQRTRRDRTYPGAARKVHQRHRQAWNHLSGYDMGAKESFRAVATSMLTLG